MMSADEDLRDILLASLKEAQIEMDQGRKPVRSIEELYEDIVALAKDTGIQQAVVDQVFREFEEWRCKPLLKWKVVLKDVDHTEVAILKARSKEEVLTGVQCVGMECAPIENVQVTQVETEEEQG